MLKQKAIRQLPLRQHPQLRGEFIHDFMAEHQAFACQVVFLQRRSTSAGTGANRRFEEVKADQAKRMKMPSAGNSDFVLAIAQ